MQDGKIKPERVGGTCDYLPETALARQKMFDTIRKVYESFGFLPIETPAIERLEVLTGNDSSFDMRLFRVAVAQGIGEAVFDQVVPLALRFDLTIPLARFVAAHPELTKPFKRYHVGPVWRGETPQLGRFCEFTQFDADIIGSDSILADTEIINLMYEVMKALRFERFVIRINSRKILNGLLSKFAGLTPRQKIEVLRILDKAEKIEEEEMHKALTRKPDSSFDETAPQLSRQDADEIIRFVCIGSGDVLRQAEAIVGDTELGQEGISELREICQNLDLLRISSANLVVDLSVARGLGYYTGAVFEVFLTDLPEIGSVYSGGRFDGLLSRFIPDSNIPGVGASVGVDRLFAGMGELGIVELKQSNTRVLITLFDQDLQPEYLLLAQELRQSGIATEVYLDNKPLKVQLGYAAKLGIPFVAIIGPDEKEAGKVSIRNMTDRTQETVSKEDLIAIVGGK